MVTIQVSLRAAFWRSNPQGAYVDERWGLLRRKKNAPAKKQNLVMSFRATDRKSRNLSGHSEQKDSSHSFGMTHWNDMDQEQVLEKARNYLSFLADHDVDVQRAWVFGSSVKDTFSENSDIDLALTMKDLTNSFLMQMHLMRLSWKFDPRIEPHPFDEDDFVASNPFANEILSTGIQVM